MMKTMEIETMGMHEFAMVEGYHEGDDKKIVLEHKHCKIRQILSHTSKTMATNNFETLTPWYC
jgi:hypothetical protein